jgi:signal transduction histidine kinase
MSERVGPARGTSWVASLVCTLLFVAVALAEFAAAAESIDTAATHFVAARKAVVAFDAVSAGPPAPNSPLWQTVALPDVVRRAWAVKGASADSRSMAWYVVSTPTRPPARQATPMALYVVRAIAGPVQVWQWQDERWQPIFDNQPWALEQWNRSLLVPVPPLAVADLPLTLAVGVPFRNGRFRALSSLWVGPLTELRQRADTRTTLQQTLPEAASIAMAALGLLSLAVWARRRLESAYLYFGIASIVWPMRNLHHFINLPRDPAWSEWFWWMTSASVSWVMLAMYFFAFRFDTRRWPGAERGLVIFVAAGAMLTLPAWGYDALIVQQAANLIVALLITGLMSLRAWQGGSRELRAIVAALWASFGFAVHDWLLVAMLITPESVYLLPYGSMLVISSFLYAAMRRFVSAVEQVEAANTLLASKLADRELELEARHLQLGRIEREQAVLVERQRLMRDMHDGVGSTLIATLRVAESGLNPREDLVDLLRMAIEDLRLAIDSLEPIEHDLSTLLATLRVRVGRRLEAAGLRMKWAMDDLPPLPWLEPGQAMQILRLLQESLTNVIKHANARNVTFSATCIDNSVVVRVADDGNGFEPALAAGGRGIPGMVQRAIGLGALFQIESAPGHGCVLSIRLPLVRPSPGAGVDFTSLVPTYAPSSRSKLRLLRTG